MRRMVHNAESDRNHALERTKLLEKQSVGQQRRRAGVDQEKLEGLERQHVKLSASQALAEVDHLRFFNEMLCGGMCFCF